MDGRMTVSPEQERPDNLPGILLMLAGFGLFSCADTIAKVLTPDFHAVQIVFLRQFGLIGGLLILFARHGPGILQSQARGWQILRGVVAVMSATCFVLAIAKVPLADAVAVSFVAPFMVTVLGAVLLGEPVGLRRWVAVSVGFLGALIIIRPGLGVFHPAIFLVVLAALAFAARQIVSRKIGTRDPTRTTVAYTGIVSVALLGLMVPFVWVWPTDIRTIFLFVALAGFAGLGEFLFIMALERTHAVILAPVHYSLILFGTFWGYIVFAQFPDFWTWIGSIILICSGIYTTWREWQNSRARRSLATPHE